MLRKIRLPLVLLAKPLDVLLDVFTERQVDLEPFHDALGAFRAAAVQGLGTPENTHQSIVVGRGNRVEFVVVAASATDGQAEDAFADDVHLIVGDVEFQVAAV